MSKHDGMMAILGLKGKPDGDDDAAPDDSMSEDDHHSASLDAAQMFIDAAHGRDPAKVLAAFKSLLELCENAPDEGGGEGGAEEPS